MDIHKSISSFSWLGKIIGFAPFYYEVNEDKIKIKFKFIWFLQFLVVKCFFPVLGIWFTLEEGRSQHVIPELWRLIVMFGLIIDSIQFLIHLSQTRRIAKLLQLIQKFDQKLQSLGCSVDYKMIQKKTFAIVTILIFAVIIMIFLTVYGPPHLRNIREIVKYSFALIHVSFFSTQFYVFTWQMKIRFEKLNNHLTQWLGVKNEHQGVVELREFFISFYNLFKICSQFNQIFTQNLTFTLISVLANEILSFYGIIRFLQTPKVQWLRLMSNLVWGLFFISINIIICYSGFSVRAIAKLSGKSIMKSMKKVRKNEDINDEVRELHNQMKILDVNIQNDFVVIDWKLLFTVSQSIIELK